LIRIRDFGEMMRASVILRRIVVPVENDPQQTHEHLPRGAKAVIDARAATRLSAVVGDGEFAEFAVAVEAVAATGPAATAAAVLRRTTPVAAIGAATLACLWAGARMNHNFSDMAAHAAADGGSFGRLNAAAGPMFGAGRDRGELSGDPAMNLKNSARVAAMAVTAAVTANGALAGDAVQWRVADGGNGHWYQRIGTLMSFTDAQGAATVRGAHLATCSDAEEWARVLAVAATAPKSELYFWIGLYQDHSAPDFAEPTGGWRWVDGTQLSFSVWLPYEPNNTNGIEDFGHGFVSASGASGWNDTVSGPLVSAFEWSADCNSDGIIDYGQCHDGTLPDYNGNNIPDCCDQGVQCTVGNYPVQWRVEDGGNGHWYRFIPVNLIGSWSSANEAAGQVGGHLATITTPAELGFVELLSACVGCPGWGPSWAIGGIQNRTSPEYAEPTGGWQWVTGENWSWSPWTPGEPNNSGGSEDFLYLHCNLHGFNDGGDSSNGCVAAIIEWSADCNNDNIVDYGQILNGQLPDTNSNNIPDCCEPGKNCCVGDIYENHIIDGGDLGVLLSEWGAVTPTTNSDLNRDGFVNGADLGMLLANWGPCGG
jgi:hypothetical protein